MAINVDISKITGINQVGNSYQRKSAVPLDYYSLFNTKAEAEAYAASNPVSYVGQVISYIDNGEVKVCVIANAAGLLKEVGTAPVGDGKTIEVSAEGAVALLGAASAANGTLPMIEEVEGKSKLVWKTLEQIGAGDGNDNTTYAFAFADQKITITPSLNGVAQTAIEVDLSVFATEDEMATAIQEAIDNLPEDKDTTYALSLSGMELTLTPSEGEAQKVTIDAYSKSEIDDKFAALPEDKDTTYSVKEGDKVLKLTGTEFATELDLVYENNRISLTGIDGEEIAGFDASVFVEDGVLQDVAYDAETRELTFTWNVVVNWEGETPVYKTDVVNIADLVDVYTAGNGLDLSDNEFAIKLAEGCESFLSVDANGLKLSGVQSAIDAAKEAAIEDAKKYEAKADASAVYTKEEANALLADKANSNDVYTKTAADTLLNAKANAADVYTKTEADNLLGAKANAADVYAKSETYTQKQVDDLLDGIQAGSSESAASVNTKLEALKKTLNNEIYGNDEGTGDSRIDTAEAKLAGIAEGAQVNVIESVAGVEGNRIAVTTTGKAVSIDDSGLRTDIADAKKAGTDAATVASQAVQAAGENANKIQTNTTDITNLKTLTGEHTTKISALESANSTHDAEFKVLKSTVEGHTTAIAGKAEQSELNSVSAKTSANEQAIKTLNETTIPGVNAEIAKKANASDLANYYTKSESDGAFVAKESGKSLISDAEIARLAEVDNYNDAEVRGLISDNASAIAEITKDNGTIDVKVKALADGAVAANAKAIDDLAKGAVADNAAAIAALKADENTDGSIAAMIKAEADRAKGVEAGHESRIAEVETFFAAIEAPDATIDTLAEIIHYIESDKSGASEMAASIKANTDAIAAINNADSGVLAQAKSYTNTEIAKLTNSETGILALAKAHTDAEIALLAKADADNLAAAKAHSDANLVTAKGYSDTNLATAKKYTDDAIAAMFSVDGKSIKLNEENKAYVAEVSTDLLVNGSMELHLVAGSASI